MDWQTQIWQAVAFRKAWMGSKAQSRQGAERILINRINEWDYCDPAQTASKPKYEESTLLKLS
jgi:hypothetical protein